MIHGGDVWHCDSVSKSFGSCGLQARGLWGPVLFRRVLIGLGSWEFGGWLNASGSSWCSLSYFSVALVVWQCTLSCWGRLLAPVSVSSLWNGCPWALTNNWADLMCQSSMNVRAKDFPAAYCIVMTWSILFTSLVSVFNVVVDCLCKALALTNAEWNQQWKHGFSMWSLSICKMLL